MQATLSHWETTSGTYGAYTWGAAKTSWGFLAGVP